jgi:hypothetical protein
MPHEDPRVLGSVCAPRRASSSLGAMNKNLPSDLPGRIHLHAVIPLMLISLSLFLGGSLIRRRDLLPWLQALGGSRRAPKWLT